MLNCLSKCAEDDPECPFVCGLGGDAGKNEHFVALMNCMVENECMDRYPEEGSCLAEDSQALDTVDYGLVKGDWWTVYGQSCGQVDEHGDWSGAHDWVPCAHSRFIQMEDGDWINNTTFCVGSNSVCTVSITATPSVCTMSISNTQGNS